MQSTGTLLIALLVLQVLDCVGDKQSLSYNFSTTFVIQSASHCEAIKQIPSNDAKC